MVLVKHSDIVRLDVHNHLGLFSDSLKQCQKLAGEAWKQAQGLKRAIQENGKTVVSGVVVKTSVKNAF